MPKYLGKGQIAECQRSGAKCLASELVRDGRNPQLLVLPEWADPAHPQERPFLPSPTDGMPRFPIAPENIDITTIVLTAEAVSGGVSLSWTPADTVGAVLEVYEVWRSTDDGDFVLLTTLDVTFGGENTYDVTEPSAYTDNTVSFGHTYVYQIRAHGNDRTNTRSAQSNLATVTDAGTVPTAVVLTGNLGGTEMDLSWTASTVGGGATITGYQVWRNVDGGAFSLLTTTAMLVYPDSSLTIGHTYEYYVIAVDSDAVESAQSNIVEGSTTQGGQLVYRAARTSSIVPGPAFFAEHPDGVHIYVTSYSTARLYQARKDSGLLSLLSTPFVSVGPNPQGAVITPDGKFIYLGCSNNSIYGFSIGADAMLTALPGSPFSAGGDSNPHQLCVTSDSAFLYSANTGAGPSNSVIAQFSIGPTGALTPLSPATVATVFGPLSVVLTPDSKFLYCSSSNVAPNIYQYSVGVDGKLTPLSPAFVSTAGVNPFASGMLVDTTGTNLYCPLNDNTTKQYSIGADGKLTFVNTYSGIVSFKTPVGNYFYGANGTTAFEFRAVAGGGLSPLTPSSVPLDFNIFDGTPICCRNGIDVFIPHRLSDRISQMFVT